MKITDMNRGHDKGIEYVPFNRFSELLSDCEAIYIEILHLYVLGCKTSVSQKVIIFFYHNLPIRISMNIFKYHSLFTGKC